MRKEKFNLGGEQIDFEFINKKPSMSWKNDVSPESHDKPDIENTEKDMRRDKLKSIIIDFLHERKQEDKEDEKIDKAFPYRVILEYNNDEHTKKEDKIIDYQETVREIISILEELKPDNKYYCDRLKKHLKWLREEEAEESYKQDRERGLEAWRKRKDIFD